MAGLLDFLNSPAGMGLLSAVAGGFAGARQNTPFNNVGRGMVSGLTGYAQANDQIRQDEENAFQKQFKQMQMEQMQRQLADQRKMRESLQALYKPAGTEPFQADNPFGEDLGNLQAETPATFGGKPVDPVMAAVLPYAQPDDIMKMYGPQANKNLFGSIQTQYYTPESLGEFQRTGDYGRLQQSQNNAVGKYNPGQYTPDSWAMFVQTGDPAVLRARFAPVTQDIGGAKVTYDPESGRELVRYQVGLKPGELPEVKAAQAEAEESARGRVKLQTEQAGKQVKLSQDAGAVDSIVTEADKLLNKATGSTFGAGLAYGKGVVGISDESTRANAGLKVLGGQLVSKIPRMEGPQSDADVKLYREMAGRVADETVPVEDRRAALRALQNINRKYANQNSQRKKRYNPATGRIE